jgi:hypothetical protein
MEKRVSPITSRADTAEFIDDPQPKDVHIQLSGEGVHL